MTDTTHPTEVERLAEALYHVDHSGDYCRASTWLYERRVRAVLRAMREPSPEMIEAGDAAMNWDSSDTTGSWFVNYCDGDAAMSWQAMIDHLLSEGGE